VRFCRLFKSPFPLSLQIFRIRGTAGAAAGAEPGHVEYSSVIVVFGRRIPPLKRAEEGLRDAEREKNLLLAREAVGRQMGAAIGRRSAGTRMGLSHA
jgi:hypothetical protein